jgi:hypothetical protein
MRKALSSLMLCVCALQQKCAQSINNDEKQSHSL